MLRIWTRFGVCGASAGAHAADSDRSPAALLGRQTQRRPVRTHSQSLMFWFFFNTAHFSIVWWSRCGFFRFWKHNKCPLVQSICLNKDRAVDWHDNNVIYMTIYDIGRPLNDSYQFLLYSMLHHRSSTKLSSLWFPSIPEVLKSTSTLRIFGLFRHHSCSSLDFSYQSSSSGVGVTLPSSCRTKWQSKRRNLHHSQETNTDQILEQDAGGNREENLDQILK